MTDYLLVHGGFQGGWVWDEVAELLHAAGHRTSVVDQLPSAGTDPQSLGDLDADVGHVRHLVDTVNEPVVLVGHSYGGMVITALADHPKVRHSVYLTALWPVRGRSVRHQLGDVLPRSIVRRDDGALEITDDFELAWQSFCPDLNRERTQRMLSRCVLQSATSFATASTAPDRTHPTTYMIATHESDGSVAAQEAWSANADYVVRLPAAHMVQLSRPRELAEALSQI